MARLRAVVAVAPVGEVAQANSGAAFKVLTRVVDALRRP